MATDFPQTSATPTTQVPRREGASIGPKTRIKGELQADEDFLIEGSFDGKLILQKHQLAIGSKGQVEGIAFAHSISVEGTVEGDLYAVERISIRKGAKIKGNVLAPRVSLEDGALLRGTVEMDGEAIRKEIAEKFSDIDLSTAPVNTTPSDSKPAISGNTSPITSAPSKPEAANKPSEAAKSGNAPQAASKQA